MKKLYHSPFGLHTCLFISLGSVNSFALPVEAAVFVVRWKLDLLM